MMVGAKAYGHVNLDLKQSLFLKEAQLGELSLSSAQIDGKILAHGLDVKEDLEAGGIVTAGWLDLGGASTSSLNLSSSSIGG